MGGKWRQYTPEELACFKAGRMYAYLDDEERKQTKNMWAKERQKKLYRENKEYRETQNRRNRMYYQRHKAALKIQRQTAQLIKEVSREEELKRKEESQKKRDEKRLKKEEEQSLKQQEKDKRSALKQRIQESKTLKEAKESLTKKSKKQEFRTKRTYKKKIPEQTLFSYREASFDIGFE